MTLFLFPVNPNCNIQKFKKRFRKLLFVKLVKRSQDEAPMKVKHLRAHMDISIEEMRSKPVRL